MAAFPEADDGAVDEDAERLVEAVVDIVRAIRNIRTQHNVEAGRWIEARIYGGDLTSSLVDYSSAIEVLAKARPVIFHGESQATDSDDNVFVQVIKETEVVIPMESMVDLAAERQRLDQEITQANTEIARLETRLADQAFLGKAPATVIERERGRLAERQDRAVRLKKELERLG